MKKIVFALFVSGFLVSCTGTPSIGLGTGFMGINTGITFSNLGFSKKDKKLLLEKKWILEKYLVDENLKELKGEDEININFEEKKIYGNGGVNGFFGNYELGENNNFKSFGPFGMTKMAGSKISMKQEENLIKLLGEITSYKIEKNKLYLLNKDNKKLLVFNEKNK